MFKMNAEENIKVQVVVFSKPPASEQQFDSTSQLFQCLNSVELLEYKGSKKTLIDDIFIKCLTDCSIKPLFCSMFAFKYASSDVWVINSAKLEDLVENNGNLIELELRVRFAFKSECTKNGQMQTSHRKFLKDDLSTRYVMNDIVIKYYFHQRRNDFIKGKLEANFVESKDVSVQLGVAVLDIVRIAKELNWDLKRVQKKVKFKRLLPCNVQKYIREMGFLFIKRTRLQFKYFINHFEHVFEGYLEGDRHHISFVYMKYLMNLEMVTGCDHCEVYKIHGECKEVLVSGDGGIIEVLAITRKQERSLDFCDIADMAVISNNKEPDDESCVVSFSLLKGGVMKFRFQNRQIANSFASCVEGYYRLLVDAHYYLNADIVSPRQVKLLKLFCHGPISVEFAGKILEEQPNVHVGDCILRQSFKSYDEFFINAVVSTQPKVIVKNYKLNRDGEFLGIYGDSKSYKYLDLESLLKSCRDGCHDPLPFQLDHIFPPQVKQVSNLIVCRCGDDVSDPIPTNVSSILLCIRHYNIVSYLGRGRFTEVKLYKSNQENDKLVVIKETIHKEISSNQTGVDYKQKQCVDDSFEQSRDLLSRVNTSHIVKFIGTIKNMIVLQHVVMGSITSILRIRGQKALEDFNEPWFLTVFWQLAHACTYLEEHNLPHGSIRGKNVLLMKTHPHPHVKLSDAGVTICSRTYSFPRTNGHIYQASLHPPWLAYEFCAVTGRSQVNVGNMTYPTLSGDRWSFATTVYEICHLGREIAWDSVHTFTAEMVQKYTTASVILPAKLLSGDRYSEFHALLRQCWSVNPPKRPPFRQILRELRSIITEGGHVFEVDEELSEEQLAEIKEPKLNLDTFYEVNLNFVKPLGKGHFGHVDLFEYIQGHKTIQVAVKALQNGTQWSGNEIETMRSLDHDFVVRLKGITSPNEMIVLEYLPEGKLYDWIIKQRHYQNNNPILHPIRNLQIEFLKFSEQIAEGMVYLQDAKILHRDLALRNILLAKDATTNAFHIKISDFGLSRVLHEDEDYYRGNLLYLPALWYAPECLQNVNQKKVYKLQSDVWSYGVLLWEMFSYCATPSYPDREIKNLLLKDLYRLYLKLKDGLRLTKPLDCPEKVYDLMKECWRFEPEDRMTFRQLQFCFSQLRSHESLF